MPAGDNSARPPIHCVLWHAPEAPPTPELTALLVQRGVTLETCANPYAAAARICRLERAARTRRCPVENDLTNGAAPPTPGLVLLLAEPSRLPMRDGVARVLELHAPRTICWSYERSKSPSLRTVALSQLALDPHPPAPAPVEVLPPQPPRPAPRLSLASSEPSRTSESVAVGAQVPINTGSVLTDEELAMLLSDGDPPARRSRTTSQEPPRSQRS